MAILLPSWIRLDDGLGDLSTVIPKLNTYAEFANHWREIAGEVWKIGSGAQVDSPISLATYIAGKLDDQPIIDVFAALKLDELRQNLAGIGQEFVDPDAPWAKLLKPANTFAETYGAPPVDGNGLDDGDNPGLIKLEIPKLATDGTEGLGPLDLTFAISASAGLECEAGSVWPFRGDRVEAGLLRIGGSGRVAAKAGFSLPFAKLGSGTVSAAASADARLDFFFRPGNPQASFADVLSQALPGIPDPLDLSAINRAIQLSRLEGIVLGCDGAVSSGLAAKVGAGYNVPEIATISAGLTAELTFKRDARWLLSLRKAGEELRFVLSRNISRERDWSLGLDIALDYGGLARQVHDALIKADGLAQPLLARVRPFLSPGTYLKDQGKGLLDAAIASILSEPNLRAALDRDLAVVFGATRADDLILAEYLRERIADFAAQQSGGILADAQTWANGIAAELAAKFPLLSATGLAASLAARVKPMLGDIQSQFTGAANAIVSAPGLARELTAAGVKLTSAQAQGDELLEGVRTVVSDFDSFSRQVIDKTGDGLNHKLQARFGWTGRDNSGVQYELAGTFSDAGADAAALWRALVTGRLEPFQRILADPDAAPASLQLEPSSSLTRFAGAHRGFSLELVAFDGAVSMASIVEGKASVRISASGDVVVSAEGTASRAVDGFAEGRGASFVSTWDLALHKTSAGRRAMAVAVAFDHNDKKLDVGEVTGFLSGLSALRLVEASRVSRALEVYQEWRTSTPPGKDVAGRIDVQMSLTGNAVDRMVALGRGAGAKGSAQQLDLFAHAAKLLLAAGVTDDERLERDCRQARREFRQLAHVEGPWRIMFGLQDVDLTPPEAAGYRGYRYTALEQLVPRAKAFPKLLAIVAQIYDAIPVGGLSTGAQWTEEHYAEAEKELAEQARIWLRLNQKFLFWFKAGIHPVLLAFLRLLADMNRPLLPGDDVFAELDAQVDTTVSSALFSIRMTRGSDTNASAV